MTKEITLTAEEVQVVLNCLLNAQARTSIEALILLENKLKEDGGESKQ